MTMRRLACCIALLLFSTPAFAQYYDYAPATPSVELNLDVLGIPSEKRDETNAESGMIRLRPPPVTRVELEPPPQIKPPAAPVAPRVSAPAVAAPKAPAPAPAAKKPDGPRLLKPFFTSQDDDAFEDALSDRVRLHTEPKARAEREKELAEAVKREEEERKKSSAPVVPSASDLTITFSGNSSKIEPEQEQKLEAAARQLSEMEGTRLQVRAYATGEDGNAGSARRIALSRALEVRSWLMDHGIQPNRVDVRALGQGDKTPMDRVDLVFAR